MRAQLVVSEPPGEALVPEGEPEGHHLVEQGARPEVGVVDETGPQVGDVLLEGVRRRPAPLAGDALAVQVGPDRRPTPAQVAGDGRDRPTPALSSAVASMSSFPVNMSVAPLLEVLAWTPKASGGGRLDGGSSVDGGIGLVSFDEQVWQLPGERGQFAEPKNSAPSGPEQWAQDSVSVA